MNTTLLDHIENLEEYISTLDVAEKRVVLQYLQALEVYKETNKILYFKPEQWQTDAINLGSTETLRAVLAGNRLGKTYFGTYEMAVHLTGKYPEGWNGLRFDKPINGLVMAVDWSMLFKPKATGELLLGRPDARGTGWIPKEDITRIVSKSGVPNAISTVFVKHYDKNGICDGESRLIVEAYSAGDQTLFGLEVDFALLDEQCPELIYNQVVKRTWSSRGSVLYVCTAERGMDEVIKRFWDEDGTNHSGLIHVSLWDSTLFTEEEKIRMNNEIPPWQRSFSIEGIPSAGTGAVFAGIMKESLLDNTFEIKSTWKRMCAADLGYRDDMVFSFIAKDDSTGIYYLYDELSYTDTDAVICAAGVRPMQQGYIPMILPADGDSERGLGSTYRSIFESAGVITKKEQARNWYYDSTGKDRTIKPGIMYMRELMLAGKLKVHPKCKGFLKEFSLYSYDEKGNFIDKDNNFIDSFRYCLMAIDKFGVSEWTHSTKSTSKLSSTDWKNHLGSNNY